MYFLFTWNGIQESTDMQMKFRIWMQERFLNNRIKCNKTNTKRREKKGIRDSKIESFTCSIWILHPEAQSLQLLIAGKPDPHEASRRHDNSWTLGPAETINQRRENKRPITDFNIIKAALKGRLDVVDVIEDELYSLPWMGWCRRETLQHE